MTKARPAKDEGHVSVVAAQGTVEGKWQYTGGEGNFDGITGQGTFKTKLTGRPPSKLLGRAHTNSRERRPFSLESTPHNARQEDPTSLR